MTDTQIDEKRLFRKARSLLWSKHKYEQAAKLYLQLVKIDDTNAKYHFGLVKCYELGKMKDKYPVVDKHYSKI